MGNRAVITTAPYSDNNLGIYVHWNGGRESVEGFLRACKALGYRSPPNDPAYGMARLAQAIGLFFGAADSTSLGIGRCDELDTDNGDNGVYLIADNWRIVDRPDETYDSAAAQAICDRIVAITNAAQLAREEA